MADGDSSDTDVYVPLLEGEGVEVKAVAAPVLLDNNGVKHDPVPRQLSINSPPLRSNSSTGMTGKRLKDMVKKVVHVNRMARPNYSSKGIPLLPRKSVVFALKQRALLAEEEEEEPSTNKIQLAATFVRDALANRNPNVRLASQAGLGANATNTASHQNSIRYQRIIERILSSMWYRLFFQLCVFTHCILACVENIPPSTSTPAFSWTPGIIELLIMLVYSFDQAATMYAFGVHYYYDKKWEPVFLLLVVACWIDWMVYYPGGQRNVFRFSRPFRTFIGVLKRKSLRRLLASVIRTIPHMISVSALLLLVVFFYATLGQQLFSAEQVPGAAYINDPNAPNYSSSNDNYDSWPEAALAMFILTTTENYPNVANPAYYFRPYVAGFFFVTALFVMLWLVCPLILAIVYNHYLETHKAIVSMKNTKQRVSLVFAYQVLMGGDGDKELDRATFKRLVIAAELGNDVRADVMFDALDVDNSGKITIAEFMRFPIAARLKLYEMYDSEEPSVFESWRCIGGCFTRWRKLCSVMVKTLWFRYATVFLVLFSAAVGSLWTLNDQAAYNACMCYRPVPPAPPLVVVAVVDVMDQQACVPQSDCNNNTVRWSSYLGLILALVQLVELFIRSTAHKAVESGMFRSRLWVFASLWNMLDAFVVVWCIFGYSGLIAGVHETLDLDVADIFEVARALPYLRIFSVMPQLRDIFETVGAIRSLILRFVLVYASISYAFAIIGMGIVGSVNQSYIDGFNQNGQMWSFETFPLAWLALLQMTVGNNWNSILYPILDAMNSRWPAWYFIIYRFFMTDIFMNVIEGVVIESYGRHEEEKEKLKMEEEVSRRAITHTHGGPNAPAAGSPAPKFGVKQKRELFDEISVETPTVLSPNPRGANTARKTSEDSDDAGFSSEEIKQLEAALKYQETLLASLTGRERSSSQLTE